MHDGIFQIIQHDMLTVPRIFPIHINRTLLNLYFFFIGLVEEYLDPISFLSYYTIYMFWNKQEVIVMNLRIFYSAELLSPISSDSEFWQF